MEFVENIDEKKYEEFVKNHIKSHFMQSYYFGIIMQKKNFKPNYVGMTKNGKLVAAALILEKKLIKKYCYLYSPRGFIIDYNDEELLKEFSSCLKKYMKKKNAIFLKIDPDLKRHDLDPDGNILSDENKVINTLKKLSYKHLKYADDFRSTEQPRFTFRLNLQDSIENINQRMHSTTKKILNKGNVYDLDISIGNKKDIPSFMITMKETAKRENIACSSEEYYTLFYETFNKHQMSDLYVAKANISKLNEIYDKKIKEINDKINELNNLKNKNIQKTKNKEKEYTNELEKCLKEKELVNEIKEDEIILSSIITVKYGNKVWTVHGGNTTALRFLNSNYLLYHQIIKDANKNGYELIDFFGTMGTNLNNTNESIKGIHSFKKRLGGEYNEFIGEFVLIGNQFLYTVYTVLIPLWRKLNRFILRRIKND